MKSRNLLVLKRAGNPIESQQRYLHSFWHSLIFLLMCAVLCNTAVAKNPRPCECTEAKFEPSKNLIKITRAPSIKQTIKALDAREPAQVVLRKKVLATADTFLQRYMNGDINRMEVPEDWRKRNGWLMGMDMGDWEKLVNRQTDANFTEWNVCPAATMASVTRVASTTVIRYEFVTVGRFTMQNKFSASENGKPFFIDVSLNDQARVVDRKQTPPGANASPYTRMDEFSRICNPKGQRK